MKTVNSVTIDNLNTAARANKAAGLDTWQAICRAANAEGFDLVEGSRSPASHEYPVALFVNTAGEHVNVWLAGPEGEEIADGAAGFDDQTNLHES